MNALGNCLSAFGPVSATFRHIGARVSPGFFRQAISMAKRVNLDAMIPRADFGDLNLSANQERIASLGLDALQSESPIFKTLRKPDFQRETNHWTARQIVDLVKSFVDDELVPSLILWDSKTFIFVIDGGHRLSALKAWIADDYGDGSISMAFYRGAISKDQKSAGKQARNLIEREVGRFTDLRALVAESSAYDHARLVRANRMFRRTLQLQWVVGTKEVAESSFYKINSQGTALDTVETSLIKNRRKPIAIAARSIVRAGTGHRYWADFELSAQQSLIKHSEELYAVLFEPEVDSPIKTLELPLGGSVSPVDAYALLIEFLEIAGRPGNERKLIHEYDDDITGSDTINVLKRTMAVVRRMTTNSGGSLGLHPAVFYYSVRGKHNKFLFLGMVELISRQVKNNNDDFFFKFTSSRSQIEAFLIKHKALITLLLQNLHNKVRTESMAKLFSYLMNAYGAREEVTVESALSHLGIEGKVYDLKFAPASKDFSEEAMSETYVGRAIQSALKCPACDGLLDPRRSVSYDHIKAKHAGGLGNVENCDLTHPFCNTAVKGGRTDSIAEAAG